MSNIVDVSKRFGGALDKFLSQKFDKRARTLPTGKYVSLCFDDFPQSAAHNAAPMIESRDWRATWYIAGGFMGKTDPIHGKMFEAADLQQLHRNGHDFGCHTFDHVDCGAVSAAELEAQRRMSAAFLAQHGIGQARSFAFPFGSVDLASKSVMTRADLALRGIIAGTNRGDVDLSLLKACGLQDNKGGTANALRELKALEKQDGWLIIFTHDVRQSPSPWGVTPDAYSDLLDAVEASGAEIVTVGDMVERLEHPAGAKRRSAA